MQRLLDVKTWEPFSYVFAFIHINQAVISALAHFVQLHRFLSNFDNLEVVLTTLKAIMVKEK